MQVLRKSEARAEYNDGLLSEVEKTRKNVEIWQDTKSELKNLLIKHSTK